MNPKRIELELTLRCNQSCPCCARHCNVYDGFKDSDMTREQIIKFCCQVFAKKKIWDTLAIMGGEPLLHPLFEGTICHLYDALVLPGLVKKLQIWTNGKEVCEYNQVPVRYLAFDQPSVDDEKIDIIISDNAHRKLHYQTFMAPKDTGQQREPCKLIHSCGFALNAYGYWPCGPGGAIARLFGIEGFGKTELPDSVEDFGNLEPLCELCQASAKGKFWYTGVNYGIFSHPPVRDISPSYQEAIRRHDEICLHSRY